MRDNCASGRVLTERLKRIREKEKEEKESRNSCVRRKQKN
jgi:hypothetical protein